MRGPLRWAQNCGTQNRGEAPSPSLRSTSPRTRGEVEKTISFSRRGCVRVLHHDERTNLLPPETKGGEAPKGAPSIGRACIGKRRRCRARQRALRSPLAFRRFAAALVAASERRNSAQAVLRATERTRALPAPSIALIAAAFVQGATCGESRV
jgi:hypothetical protein